MRFLLACQPRNHYLLLVNEFQPKPSSERKGDRLRWKEPACILTFYVLWIEYFVEKSKNITDTLNISSLTARTLPQSPSVTAPSRKEPLACSYSLFDFRLSGKAFIEPRHYGGVFVLQKRSAEEILCRSLYISLFICSSFKVNTCIASSIRVGRDVLKIGYAFTSLS